MWLPSASDLALPFVIQPLQALHHNGYFAFSREDFCLLGTPSYSFHCTYTIIPICMVIRSLKTVVASHPLSCTCTVGAAVRKPGFFGQGSGSVFSVSVSESGSIRVVPTQEEKCSHDNDAALFCVGMLKFLPRGSRIH